MAFKTKRSFLLESIFARKFDDDLQFKKSQIAEFYTEILPNEVKFSRLGEEYFKTTNEKIQNFTQSRRINITKNEFKAALSGAIGYVVTKNRFYFNLDNRECVIDFYTENFCDIAILHIKFSNKNEAERFEIPKFLQNLLIKEITKEANYSTKNLALFGKPLKIDYKNCLKRLEILGDIRLNFNAQIASYDAARLVLFKIYGDILRNILNYIKNRDFETLIALDKSLTKIAFWLKFLPEVIDERIGTKFEFEFLKLSEQIEDLTTQISASNAAYKNNLCLKNERIFSEKLQQSKENLMLALSEKKFYETMKSLEFVLNDESELYCEKNAFVVFKQNFAYNLRRFIIKILAILKSKNISKYSQNQCENLLFLLENFGDLLALKGSKKLIKRLKNLVKLSALVLKNSEILEIEFDSNSSKIHKKSTLNIKKCKKKFLKKQPKMVANLHKFSQKLKVYYV